MSVEPPPAAHGSQLIVHIHDIGHTNMSCEAEYQAGVIIAAPSGIGWIRSGRATEARLVVMARSTDDQGCC